jgi:microsomal dipeptidase-like Zn-dependent dipeptidase
MSRLLGYLLVAVFTLASSLAAQVVSRQIPVVRPGDRSPSVVPVVIPDNGPQLTSDVADLRSKGSAPTGVSATATSPFAVMVHAQLSTCAAGFTISVGTPGGSSREFYHSDTLPPSTTCSGPLRANRGLVEQTTPVLETIAISDPGPAGPASQSVGPLQPSTTYTIKVGAFYRDSAPATSEQVTVKTQAPPPFTIAALSPSTTSVTIRWNPAVQPSKYVVYRDNDWVADAAMDLSYDDRIQNPYVPHVYRIDAVYKPVNTGPSTSAMPSVVISATATTKPPISGFADTHTHPFANLASGGRVFWGAPYGPIDSALAPCDPAHGLSGLADVIGNVEAGGRFGHQTGGSPHFEGWPNWKTFDHQQMYSDWIYRAFQGGLRLIVALGVNNATICEASYKDNGRTCDDMEAADLQIEAVKKMEAYIDSTSGGPGKGWFRIAYSPEQARQIIYSGKLAVVLGVEVDELFGCGKDQCDSSRVHTELRKLYLNGVRHVIPLHFTDNAFGGFALTGTGFEKALFKLNSKVANKDVLKPVQEEDCSASGYGQPCNKRGLTPLGADLIREMMSRGMIIDIDHMSKRTTDSVLAITSASHYPVIGGHTGFIATSIGEKKAERDKTESQLTAMKQDGGMVSVGVTAGSALAYTPSWRSAVPNTCDESSRTFAQSYLYAVDKMGGPGVAAVGLATDQFLNNMEGPRFDGHCPGENNSTRVTYPITTRHGVHLGMSQIGDRAPFDYNADGLAHFGMLPDFVQDLKNDGLTDRDLDPLFRSAEGYIRLWERAVASIPVP